VRIELTLFAAFRADDVAEFLTKSVEPLCPSGPGFIETIPIIPALLTGITCFN
jgi:hypothetical protein